MVTYVYFYSCESARLRTTNTATATLISGSELTKGMGVYPT